MQTSHASRSLPVGDAVFAASRQVWLASLGAAVVTRDWAGKEAGTLFRSLVREGTTVESRAIRFISARVGTSMTHANRLLRQTRSTLQTAVRTYSDTASNLVRETLPRARPMLDLVTRLGAIRPSGVAHPVKRAKAARRVKTVKAAKHSAKRAGKRIAKRAVKRVPSASKRTARR